MGGPKVSSAESSKFPQKL